MIGQITDHFHAAQMTEDLTGMKDDLMSMKQVPFSPDDFVHCDTWILDVDDTLYDIDNLFDPEKPGFHDEIKQLIISTWNAGASDELKSTLAGFFGELAKEDDAFEKINASHLKQDDLSLAFPHILRAIQAIEPDALWDWLATFYGDKYDTYLTPNPELVEALTLAEKAGVKIVLHTNGPSHSETGKDAHVQKVLRALGFDEEFIDKMRGQTQDLVMASHDGAGKPSTKAFKLLCQRFDISPQRSLMCDDGPKNIVSAQESGAYGIWTWASSKTSPKQSDIDLAFERRIPRVRHTSEALLSIAYARAIKRGHMQTPSFQSH